MPLGDSITYGFVGPLSNEPDSLSNKDHEGHPRWTIRQIAASINESLRFSRENRGKFLQSFT